MSYETVPGTADEGDRLIRLICFGGFIALPALILFVHLLLIYRS
jgi:hypothetical protein